jgi:hypothetical protein
MTLDLTDALCGNSPDRTDISELGLTAIDESVATAYDIGGTLIQRGEHALQSRMLLSVQENLVWTRHRLTCDQIAQSRVAAFLDWRIEADVVAAVAHQVKYPVGLEIHLCGDLLDLRIPPEPPLQGPPDSANLVDLLCHMHWQPDDPTLLGDPTADRLPHPPRTVRRELEPLGVVELLDCTDKTGIAFLDQIQEGHLRTAVLASNRDHQTKVGGHEMLHRSPAFLSQKLQLGLGGPLGAFSTLGKRHVATKDVLRVKTKFDRLGELDLLLGAQQRSLSDAFQI